MEISGSNDYPIYMERIRSDCVGTAWKFEREASPTWELLVRMSVDLRYSIIWRIRQRYTTVLAACYIYHSEIA